MEAEALLNGPWKNIDELEENVTLEELEARIKASRDKEYRMFQFYASFKGVNLDEDTDGETPEDRVRAAKIRANAILTGKTEEEIQREVEAAELADFGIEIET